MRMSDWSSDVCSSDLNIDEIVEGVFALAGLAREIPRPPQIIAAANMRDGIDHAPVDEAEPRRGESRRDAVAVRAIDIEVHRRAAVARRDLFIDARGEIGRASCRARVCQ